MNKIENALQNPYFQLFLGRRSLPINVDYYQGNIDNCIMNVMRNFPWQASTSYQNKNKPLLDVIVDADLQDEGLTLQRQDSVISLSTNNRKYGFRGVKILSIELSEKSSNETHDIFESVGSENVHI